MCVGGAPEWCWTLPPVPLLEFGCCFFCCCFVLRSLTLSCGNFRHTGAATSTHTHTYNPGRQTEVEQAQQERIVVEMSVLIGRRELFAFAERYSSCRLKDYTDLADGVVLCNLFNLVFPEMRIRTASPQTHTLSQRTQINWAALRSALDEVGIPQNLLDQGAIHEGDAKEGFSALVLFYFLYHLTKRTDFSAEFAADVSDVLTEFLQSIDSIAALFVGGALPLDAVPPQLQELLSKATMARKRRTVSKHVQRGEGSMAAASLFTSGEDNGARFERQLSFDSEVTSVGQPVLDDEAVRAKRVSHVPVMDTARNGQPHDHDKRRKSNKEKTVSGKVPERNRSVSISSRSSQMTRGEKDLMDTDAVKREVELQQALISKSEECEKLKMQKMELLSKMEKMGEEKSVNLFSAMPDGKDATKQKLEEEQRRVTILEEELMYLRRILQKTREERCNQIPLTGSFAEELLKDVVDTETGEVVNVHETATSLHGVILDALRDSPRRRREAQRWLWLIVSAYHVIETRLVTACDVAAMEWQRLEKKLLMAIITVTAVALILEAAVILLLRQPPNCRQRRALLQKNFEASRGCLPSPFRLVWLLQRHAWICPSWRQRWRGDSSSLKNSWQTCIQMRRTFDNVFTN
ncbi:hypothetical protein TCDM_09948 [Trypanosoma cruzi Dm28c]|uniref:Calponin-homology (CH) domain-containing protein n=1 Tax=Trypanosoma cruzi Dm28c TaxID=1416333 RepID=V5D4H6_TRYCR|nr:hypothetical protein TCDM_09948 [Trypanosoma cruzi Dm28c]